MMYDSLIKYFNGYSSKPLTGDEIDLIRNQLVLDLTNPKVQEFVLRNHYNILTGDFGNSDCKTKEV